LHVLLLPDSFDSLVIHTPAQRLQQTMRAWTAKPWATVGDATHHLQ